jgi:hypothetical protein|tara:strand:+ start:6053 stop:6358 length:306 start_codon:yes stop_codon:yes gene_type:complete
MIERLAKRLYEEVEGGGTPEIWKATEHRGDCTKDAWTCPVCLAEEYRGYARAMLEEIREPTQAMLDPMHTVASLTGHEITICGADIIPLWQGMVDAAREVK